MAGVTGVTVVAAGVVEVTGFKAQQSIEVVMGSW